ncbi:uridine monophosphate kinase [Coprothermobacteraceae bacterium]|nr:uridine monophosphate kinase [Coprothermobacteraceae bacterium]
MEPFRRLLLKLSGELLSGENEVFSAPYIIGLGKVIRELHSRNVEVAIVVGGGNIFRGRESDKLGMNPSSADYVGMLATAVNGLVIKSVLEGHGVPAELVSSFEIEGIAHRKAVWHIREIMKSSVILFVGGTGMPHLTTDTLSAIRAVEVGADVLVKFTKVDGVYDKDPIKHRDAIRYEVLSFQEALDKRLGIMDLSAFEILKTHRIPVAVIKGTDPNELLRFLDNPRCGTLVLPDKEG